jgi:hypothetical protein
MFDVSEKDLQIFTFTKLQKDLKKSVIFSNFAKFL